MNAPTNDELFEMIISLTTAAVKMSAAISKIQNLPKEAADELGKANEGLKSAVDLVFDHVNK